MKTNKFLPLGVILLLGMLTVPLASAIEKGGYFGIATGDAEGDTSVSDFDDPPPGSLTSGSLDDTDSGLKLFGGVQFTDGLAIEGGFIDFGKVTFDGVSDGSLFFLGGYAPGPVSADIETKGLYLAVVGMKSFLKLSVFGKLGVLAWGADGEFVDTSGSFDLDDVGIEESGESTVVGLGIEFRPTDKIGIRGEWEQYQDALADERDIDLLSVGVIIRR